MDKGSKDKPEHLNTGHRKRLRSRFLNSGIASLAEHEIVELLLTYAIPRKDVKPLAKELLKKYGSVAKLLDAEADELLQQHAVGENAAALIVLLKELCIKYLEAPIQEHPILLDSTATLHSYLKMKIAGIKYETLLVMYLDSGNRVLQIERCNGSTDHIYPYPVEITRHAISLRTKNVIIAHNHPSGNPMPSRDDIDFTRQLMSKLKAVDIILYDHLIVTSNDVVSVLPLLKPGLY